MAEHMRSELVVPPDGDRPPAPEAGPDSSLRPGVPIRVSGLRSGRRRGGHCPLDGLPGDCFDNAVAESFFATLKKELVHRRSWPTRRELSGEVFAYVEAFYNRTRRHSTLGMLSPSQFEDEHLSQEKINSK
jgi:putative transposase